MRSAVERKYSASVEMTHRPLAGLKDKKSTHKTILWVLCIFEGFHSLCLSCRTIFHLRRLLPPSKLTIPEQALLQANPLRIIGCFGNFPTFATVIYSVCHDQRPTKSCMVSPSHKK